MNALPNARYERKLLAPGFAVAEVLALVRRHPAGFRQAYPERIVNNIYLDSTALASYHDHVNGSSNRVKLRVRWYGEAAGRIDKPVLEEKLKRGAVSGKTGHPLASLALNGEPLHGLLDAAFTVTALPEWLRERLRHLAPTLFNRYCRHYFLSGDGLFRLTVDTGLKFARLRKGSASPDFLIEGNRDPIIELKHLPEHAERTARVTNAFPFRLVRCSKYVLGIERTAGA